MKKSKRKKQFSEEAFEHHFNSELMLFCFKLRKMALKHDYPYIKYFLEEALDRYRKMDKDSEYRIFGMD